MYRTMNHDVFSELRDGLTGYPGIISEDYARANYGIHSLRAAIAEFAACVGVESIAVGYAVCPDWKGGKRMQVVFGLYEEDIARLQAEDRKEWDAAQAEYQKREAVKAENRAANPDWDER